MRSPLNCIRLGKSNQLKMKQKIKTQNKTKLDTVTFMCALFSRVHEYTQILLAEISVGADCQREKVRFLTSRALASDPSAYSSRKECNPTEKEF